MDYEKNYIQLRNFITDLYPHMSDYCKEKVEGFFPELAESEDERIRRCIGDAVRKYGEEFASGAVTKEKMLAWLEKQGEKSTTIDVDKMVMEYSQTKDGNFGLPVNCMIRAYRQGINDALRLSLNLEKQGEPQPYKGNSDTMRKNLIKAFKTVGTNHWGGFDVRDIIHFLESKDAIELEKQGEQNSAWSEENEKWIDRACMLLDELNHLETLTLAKIPHNLDEIISHIKSLKPQSHWKPTEEQLGVLQTAMSDYSYSREYYIIESLYNELKKL